MRFSYILALGGLLVSMMLDAYVWRRLRRADRWLRYLYILLSSLCYIALATAVILPRQAGDNNILTIDMWLIFYVVSLTLAKTIYVTIDLMAALPRLWRHRRWSIMSRASVCIALTLFGAMWWGALINRNRIAVTETVATSSRWPHAFDGYRIAQISDLHTGTWDGDTTFMSRLVDRINGLNPDLIVFTGDIVNMQSSEFEPMVPVFARLSAPDGVYAVMGNHDYGDYRRWPDDATHTADRENLKRLYHATGKKLLLNETVYLTRGDDSIALIGVENIGRPPYYTYGDLSKAYPTVGDDTPKILLSHNPAHWVNDILNNPAANVDLTLSGHTHAMQIQIGGHTPSSFLYETPWGEYTDTLGRMLYVNRGSGTVGMPMRLGATPEITLITLKRD